MPKKIKRGDPLVSAGFVGHIEKVKSERGTLCTKFALAGLGALGGFRIVSKKWTDQCEDCSLKKTRRERLKWAPYLRLKKRKTFFWKKLKLQKKSHSAEKCKGGTLLDLLTHIPLQNIKKLEGGSLSEH